MTVEDSTQRRSAMVSTMLAGELNRARVLKSLYAAGPLSRSELARMTGSTRATIGQIVQPLLDQGLLQEHEPTASGVHGGKPPRPVWFSDDGWTVGAMLMLPGGAQVALVTAGGQIKESTSLKFDLADQDQDTIVTKLADAMNDLIAKSKSPVRDIGIASAGMVDTKAGTVVRVDAASWQNGLAIGPLIAERTGIPAHVDLHIRAQALGDLLFGQGRNERSFCSLYVGEGIGAGFIMDGDLYRGARGAGGEVGHAVVEIGGTRCLCGLDGCWETVASLRWLRQAARERGLPDPDAVSAAALSSAAASDPVAATLLEDYARNISYGIANLQQTLGIGLFIIHGDPAGGDERFRKMIEDQTRKRSFSHPGGDPVVVLADTDDFATLRGAGSIVLARSLHIQF